MVEDSCFVITSTVKLFLKQWQPSSIENVSVEI